MGSPCQIHVMGEKKTELDEFAQECRQQALGFEKKYSRYRSDSILTKINRSAGKKPTKIDAETFALLNYAQVCYEQSKGFFDITSGVLRNLWTLVKYFYIVFGKSICHGRTNETVADYANFH